MKNSLITIGILVLGCVLFTLMQKYRKAKREKRRNDIIENFKARAETVLTFRIADILTRIKGYEGKDMTRPPTILDSLIYNISHYRFHSVDSEMHRANIHPKCMCSDVLFKFEYNGIEMNACKTFYKDKQNMEIHFLLQENLNVYIIKGELGVDFKNYDTECSDIIETKKTSRKPAYMFYIDLSFVDTYGNRK